MLNESKNDNEIYQIHNGILFQRERTSDNWIIILPVDLHKQIIKTVHSKLGHLGVYKTLNHLKRFYYWKIMQREVKDIY